MISTCVKMIGEPREEGWIKKSFTVSTYKLFCNWEVVKQLDTAKVISSGQSSTRVVEVGCIHVCLVSIFGPNSDYLITKHTV